MMLHNFKVKTTCFIVILLMVSTMLLTLPVLGADKKVIVQTPPIPAALPFLWMKEEGKLDNYLELEVKLSPDHSRALALISKNQIDFMITGANVGAKAYNKGIDLKMMNVNTWAIDYLLTNGFKADSWQDLKGKSLSLPLKGGPLDFLIRYFLRENNVALEKVNLVYRPLPNGARFFMAGKVDAIALPEPLVTVSLIKNKNAHLSLDLQKEWAKLHDGDERIPYVGLFVSGKFARENPGFTELINGMYMNGVDWINENPDEAAALAAKYFGQPEPLLKKSLTRVNVNCYPEQKSTQLLETYFQEIMDMYPEMIGGKLPDVEFYF